MISRKRPGPPIPPPPRSRYGLVVLLTLLAAALAWYWFHPEDYGRLMDMIRPSPVTVTGLKVTRSGEQIVLNPGDTLEIRPEEPLSVEGPVSNRYQNYDLRLYSPELDPFDLSKPRSLLEILGEDAFAEPIRLNVQVKEGDRVLAEMTIASRLSADDWLQRAEAAKEPERKIRYLRQVLKTDPARREILRQLADLLEKAEQFSETVTVLEQYMGGQDDPGVLTRILALEKRIGDPEKERAALERLMAVAPDKDIFRHTMDLADLLVKEGQAEEAAHRLEALALARQGAEREKALSRAETLFLEAGGTGAVADFYARVTEGDFGEATAEWLQQQALKLDEQGEVEQAISAYTALRDRFSGDERSRIQKRIGFLLAKTERWPDSIAAYELAASMDPGDRTVYLNLSRLYRLEGDLSGAIRHLSLAASMDPSDARTQERLAEILLEAGHKLRAATVYEQVVRIDPENMGARRHVIALLEELGRAGEAVPHYEYLLKKNPKNKVLHYNLGVIRFDAGDFKAAGESMNQVVKLDPADKDAHQYLLEIYRQMGDKERAVAEARELIKLGVVIPGVYETVLADLEAKKQTREIAAVLADLVTAKPGRCATLETPRGFIGRFEAHQGGHEGL